MRNILLSLLCSFYLFSSSGAKLAVHYCHGHFQTVTFNAKLDEDSCCGSKRQMNKGGCCEDKIIEIKVKEEQKISSATLISFDPKLLFSHYLNTSCKNISSIALSTVSPHAHAPPNLSQVPGYIYNGTFRI